MKIKWWQFWKWKAKALELQSMVAYAKLLHTKDLDELHAVKIENYALKEILRNDSASAIK